MVQGVWVADQRLPGSRTFINTIYDDKNDDDKDDDHHNDDANDDDGNKFDEENPPRLHIHTSVAALPQARRLQSG